MDTEQLFMEMFDYYSGDPKRIQHFIKVHSFALRIGMAEHLDEKTLFILETAAIVHDIGIKVAEEKYGFNNGKSQEAEGPAVAKAMLEKLHYSQEVIDRVCYLVGHHHTYTEMDGIDYQILVEADFLVNIFEDNMSKDSIASVQKKIFQTETGKKLLSTIY